MALIHPMMMKGYSIKEKWSMQKPWLQVLTLTIRILPVDVQHTIG